MGLVLIRFEELQTLLASVKDDPCTKTYHVVVIGVAHSRNKNPGFASNRMCFGDDAMVLARVRLNFFDRG